jgi:hypothetical protein
MNISSFIVGLIIVLAVIYLLNHFRKSFNGSGGCSCGSSHCASCHVVAGRNKTAEAVPPCCQNKN